jgi:hypothetical protein
MTINCRDLASCSHLCLKTGCCGAFNVDSGNICMYTQSEESLVRTSSKGAQALQVWTSTNLTSMGNYLL